MQNDSMQNKWDTVANRAAPVACGDSPPIAFASTFRRFETLDLTAEQAQYLGLGSPSLTLRRVWPRADDQFGLEYIDGGGDIVPGQWFESPAQLQKVQRATARMCTDTQGVALALDAHNILLQTGGADRRLPGLATLLDRPDARLVAHRPERRAVVELAQGICDNDATTCFAKIVRPSRVAALIDKMETIYHLADGSFQTPNVLAADEAQGILWLSALSGASLHTLLDGDKLIPAAEQAGCVLRALHTLAPPLSAAAHNAQAEIAVIHHWFDQLTRFAPELTAQFEPYVDAVCQALADGTSPAVLLHRDFYDKQIFVTPTEQAGLLDFDTLAVGEGALDVANALIHFELRAMQHRGTSDQIAAAAIAFLQAYAPSSQVLRRLSAYANGTRLRLASVYAFRPYGVDLVPGLLDRIGQTLL